MLRFYQDLDSWLGLDQPPHDRHWRFRPLPVMRGYSLEVRTAEQGNERGHRYFTLTSVT
jgi:hypothetical protein